MIDIVRFPADDRIPDPDKHVLDRIRHGDRALREEYLARYHGMARGIALRYRYGVDPDEACSIGLLALDEALMSYRPEKSCSFRTHAGNVIRARLIDEARRMGKARRWIPFSWFTREDGTNNPTEPQWRVEGVSDPVDRLEVAGEIGALTGLLLQYGVSMADLSRQTPRHMDARRAAIRLGILLAEDESLFRQLVHVRALPVPRLARQAGVNVKTVSRHKAYILLIALIWNSHLDTCRSYIRDLLKEGMNHG